MLPSQARASKLLGTMGTETLTASSHHKFFFSKLQRRSPESQRSASARSPEKRTAESFGEVAPKKPSPMKEALTKITWRSAEAKICVPQGKRDSLSEHQLPQKVSRSEAGPCWLTPGRLRCSKASVGHSDTCVALVHGHWDLQPEREQDLAQGAEGDTLSTTSTLRVTTPFCDGSQDTKISPDSSVTTDTSSAQPLSKTENCSVRSETEHLATMEGNCATRRQGEGVTGEEEGCVTSGSISQTPVGSAGRVFTDLGDAQASLQKPDDLEAKASEEDSPALQTKSSLPGKDSLESAKSRSVNIVHGSDQAAVVEPETGEVLLAEEASCNMDRLQKPGDLSSLELSVKANLPSDSTNLPETDCPLGVKSALEDAPGVDNKADQPSTVEKSSAEAFSPQLEPGKPLPAGLDEALTSVSLESPQPIFLMQERPSSFTKETAVEEN